jgi:hypothetical protein
MNTAEDRSHLYKRSIHKSKYRHKTLSNFLIEKSFRPIPVSGELSTQLKLIDEFNGILTYANQSSGENYAFYQLDSSQPVFLPCLSRILYGSKLFNEK